MLNDEMIQNQCSKKETAGDMLEISCSERRNCTV